MTTQREQLADAFYDHPWQGLRSLREDDKLMKAAQWHAEDMCDHGYFEHENLQGAWPNGRVRDAGYKLPPWYEDDSNQVESIAMGYRTAEEAVNALFLSDDHHPHVAGSGFWSNHERFGVGHAYDGTQNYYVIVTAPPEPDDGTNVWLPVIMKGVTP